MIFKELGIDIDLSKYTKKFYISHYIAYGSILVILITIYFITDTSKIFWLFPFLVILSPIISEIFTNAFIANELAPLAKLSKQIDKALKKQDMQTVKSLVEEYKAKQAQA